MNTPSPQLQFSLVSPEKLRVWAKQSETLFNYHPDAKRNHLEPRLVAKACTDGASGKRKVYCAIDAHAGHKAPVGIVALSAGSVKVNQEDFPAIVLDLLFVDYAFRKAALEDGAKISMVLLDFAIQKALEVKELIGVRYLVLWPEGGSDNQKLVSFYKEAGFRFMDEKRKEWMFVKI